jgi:phosphate-selective porin OprO and OprP
MKHVLIAVLTIGLCWGFVSGLYAGVSETDALIQLLLQKKLITPEEAAALRADLAVQKQEEKDKQKEFQVTASKPIQLSGYTQFRYRSDRTITDTFDIRRARLTLKGGLGMGFDYMLQSDFAGSSAKLMDAALGWRLNDAFKVTAGQQKIPFSQENLIGDNVMETINRSQVVESLVARSGDVIGNQNGRDIGLMVGGNFNLFGRPGLLEYAVGGFNGSGMNTADTNERKDLVGRLIAHPFEGFSIGGSFYTGRYTLPSALTKEDVRQRAGGEIAYLNGPFVFKGEYIHGYDARKEKDGWYALAAYTTGLHHLQAVLKYDTFDPDKSMSKNEENITTIGINCNCSKWAQVQVNYEIKDETGKEISNNAFTVQFQLQF